jgi:hypothetical protein
MSRLVRLVMRRMRHALARQAEAYNARILMDLGLPH